jgi:outer membrane receptor protein involved in Fe transport
LATAQLNIQNLFDKVYFDHGGSGGTRLNSYYGEPRTVTASLRVQF